jgi:hypothetical protein
MRYLSPLTLAAAALFVGCSGDQPLPTAPDAPGAQTNAAAEAKGGKGPKGPKGGGDLRVAIQPDVWNTQWTNSQGTVSALIEGSDLDKIDLDTIVLVGEDGTVEARRAQLSGPHVRAFFPKGEAIEALDSPARGETHEIKIAFTQDGTDQSLTASVRIVGPPVEDDDDGDDDEEAELGLEIQPDHWNTNWRRSNGTVTALIRGEGLGQIDLNSFELVGTDPAAEPALALRARRSGNHVRAFFAMKEAFATLDTPKPGEEHDILIRFDGPDGPTELEDTIVVVGPNR